MSGHHEAICKIDIPAARKEILEQIAEHECCETIATIVQEFAQSISGKKIDRRAGDKLRDRLIENSRTQVFRVLYSTSNQLMNQRPAYKFVVESYAVEYKMAFEFAVKEDGSLDIDWAMAGHRQYATCAAVLKEKLGAFAYNATKFNELVDALKERADFASLPAETGIPGAVYPLSKFFHWYQLK